MVEERAKALRDTLIGGGCFTMGTLIATPEGERPFDPVKAGDKAVSADPVTKRHSERRVLETHSRQVNEPWLASAENGRTIQTAVEHAFWVGGKCSSRRRSSPGATNCGSGMATWLRAVTGRATVARQDCTFGSNEVAVFAISQSFERIRQSVDQHIAAAYVLEGPYEEGLSFFVQLAQEQPDIVNLNNLGWAYLMGKRYQDALRQYRLVSESHPAHSLPRLGAVLWLLGNKRDACGFWVDEIERLRSGTIQMTDWSGGIEAACLLFWGSAHSGLEDFRKTAIDQLKRKWKTKRCQRTPLGGLAGYLVGEMDESQLLSRVKPSAPMNEAITCSVLHFYIAAKALADHDFDAYQTHLLRCVELGSNTNRIHIEFSLAMYEIEKGPERSHN